MANDERIAQASAAIANPASQEHPPWASRLTWGDVYAAFENCTASLVRREPYPNTSWVLTAAHCFGSLPPGDQQGTTFGALVTAENVFFHPNAYGVPTLADLDPTVAPGLPSPYADLALVRIQLPFLNDDQPVKLWHTADAGAATAWLQGRVVSFAGLVAKDVDQYGNPVFGPATGTATASHLDGSDLVAKPISHLEQGDSGGGAWITLEETAPPSIGSFPSACAIEPGSVGEPVLVGVNRAGVKTGGIPSEERFTAVYPPKMAEWIASVTRADDDVDLVCDLEDNCPTEPNPGQENSNLVVEDAWGGVHLGDRCDPAPTPLPNLLGTKFAKGTLGGPIIYSKYLVTAWLGRDIADDLAVSPVLDDGSSLSSEQATPLFCDCRDEQLHPIADAQQCMDPDNDFRCLLDTRQADGDFTEVKADQASIAAKQTAWHRVTVGAPVDPVKGASFPVDYPGPVVTRRWHYETDYDFWVTEKGWMSPAAPPGPYGPGTDLGGALWAHTASNKGAEAHGLPAAFCDPKVELCTIADGFAFGVAPDRRGKQISGGKLLVAANLPLCPPSCPWIDLGQAIYPEPFVALSADGALGVLWADGRTAREATELLSPALRALVVRDDVWYAPASEPVSLRSDELLARLPDAVELAPDQLDGALGEPSSPRALFIAPAGGGSVDLLALVRRASGQLDVTPVESLGGEVRDELARLLGDPTARARVTVVYSRTADALYVVHSGAPGFPPLPPGMLERARPRPGMAPAPWRRRPLAGPGWFHREPRAVFSPADWRIWALDTYGPVGHPLRRLRRIAASTGEVETDKLLPSLGALDEPWLATYDDGRVLFAGNRRMGNAGGGGPASKQPPAGGKPERFVLALLGSVPFSQPPRLSLDGVFEGQGQLVAPPRVSRGVISVLVRKEPASKADAFEAVALGASELTEVWPALADDLEDP